MSFFEAVWLFFLCSVLGWVGEIVAEAVRHRHYVDKSLLFGPLCPIYGTGAILGVAILGNVHNPIIIFLISMVGATILEYTTSWVMEQLFHALEMWYDFHLGGMPAEEKEEQA